MNQDELSYLLELEQTLRKRRDAPTSSIASNLVTSPKLASSKLVEESAELFAALRNESDERVVSESADVLFALLCGLSSRGLKLADAARELEKRDSSGGS